jgi:hypothetical protein
MLRRAGLWLTGSLATLLAMVVALVGVGGAPAQAHSAGKAVVLVRQFTLTPAASGWTAAVTVADFDSGAPIRNSKVILLTGAPAAAGQAATTTQTAAKNTQTAAKKTTQTAAAAPAQVTLAPTGLLGVYQGQVPNVKAGPNHLELRIQTQPGSDPVQPYDKAWDVTLVAGQPYQVVAGGTGGGGGSNLGLILGVAGGVVAVALLYGLFMVRRRTAVPAQVKPRDVAGV